jgi:hypothetical protein
LDFGLKASHHAWLLFSLVFSLGSFLVGVMFW